MEEYPDELRNPPVALISLVGCPEHHPAISSYLHSQQHPINVLALPDFSKVPVVLAKKVKDSGSEDPPGGILKRDWLLKHRTKIPALVAVLFSSLDVSGGPTQWLQVCSDLENLKAAIRPRNVKLVVVVVLQSSSAELHADGNNEDRMIALKKRAEVDSKYLLMYTPNDVSELKQSLDRLGNVFSELASAHYREEGRRIRTKVEKRGYNFPELHMRYCFKVAIYAEFRRDWNEALKFYEEAYRILRQMVGTKTRLPPIQRIVEINSVAEQLQFKISTLLLHGGKVLDAVQWFCQHNVAYRRLVRVTEAPYLHWEWMSRQFLVFAELLETSSATMQSISSFVVGGTDGTLTEWEFRPAYYYQLAATYLKKKQSSLEISLSMTDNSSEVDSSIDSVVPSTYVGQFARLLEQGDELSMQPLSDEQYVQYTLAEGKRFQDSYEIIALLKRAYESYSSLKAQRMGSTCGLEIAKEYFFLNNYVNTKQVCDDIITLYRQEGWVALIWEVLGYLRECSRKLGAVKSFIEYSLEMAALPVLPDTSITFLGFMESGPAGLPSLQQREHIQKEVMELFGKDSRDGLSAEKSTDLRLTEENPLNLEIDLVSPLRTVMLASVAFHEQMIKPSVSTLITLSLLSQLPLSIQIDKIDLQFNQPQCNFSIINKERYTSTTMISSVQKSQRMEKASSLVLTTNRWLRLTFEIKSEQSGKLECVSIIVKLGPHFSIICRAESPASMDDLPLWKFEDRVETFPTKDPTLALTGQKATQIEEPEPHVDLALVATGPALVGESFIVPVTISAKGHDVYSGELKINLVDVRGDGLFSPRETEASFLDGHHVELLGIAGAEQEGKSQGSYSNINRIQQSFGLVSIPNIKNGETWSCELEIKWHQPKPIMLFVSLGYSSQEKDSTSQKINIHKSLQIEGKIAVTINHRIMLPFRRDPLLLSMVKPFNDADQLVSLPLGESNVLIVSASNCTEIPIWVESLSIETDFISASSSCCIKPGSGPESTGSTLLVAEEEYKKVFTVKPEVDSAPLSLGIVCLRWRRDPGHHEPSTIVTTKHRLPHVNVEVPTLIVSSECPPYAVLGDPLTYFVKIQNQTPLLQELKVLLSDSQSFLMSGTHSGTVFVLPKSDHVLSYKVIPLSSGTQQLPKYSLTSSRYSAGFQPSSAASTIFVFPSKPLFKGANDRGKNLESVATI
ncbi:hypothetical protein SAY86_032078 [Trapa natans]|uniref:Trafficking protein particle complex subunit 11 domain-containing protein n=1 Tax=Trapa natans TaxID=22666 RepID=A0AAN7M8K2_TRANT|nr:hypothetical protein SAY86_032078 [Trapa natans]